MTPDHFNGKLKNILTEFRFEEVQPLINEINPEEFTPAQAKTSLSLLRRKRLFAQLEETACLFEFAGVQSPALRRQWAQALLDQGRVRQAILVLVAMRKTTTDPNEQSEVQGLIGRAYKQLFVEHGNPDDLVTAIQAYHVGWHRKQGDYRWHGINLAALINRASQEGIDPGVNEAVSAVARQLLDEISGLKKSGYWDYGTAMEASIALGDEKSALDWLRKYINHPDVDAFELASTLRQMREIWGLQDTALGRKVIPVIEGQLIRKEGGTLEAAPTAEPDPIVYEAVFGAESAIQLEWVRTMHQRCRAVGRVFNSATGTRYGTGFLVKGSVLNEAWQDAPVFVTNSHVLSDNPTDEARLASGDGSAEFTAVDGRPAVRLGQILFSSPKTKLDVTVTRIQPPNDTECLDISSNKPSLPDSGDESAAPRIYVIGHPQVGELSVTLYDNRLVAYEHPYVLYRSPTERGSSGSPVFTRDWKLFALHHTSKGWLRANQGVLFESICQSASG